MKNRSDSVLANLDWLTVGIFAVLMLCGWLSIYSAGYSFEEPAQMFSFSTRAGKQLVWILCSLVLCTLLVSFSQNFYRSYSYLFYVLVVLLLLVTIFVAKDVKGSRSWLQFGPVSLQPAEFAKFATALALARYLDSWGNTPKRWMDYARVSLFFIVPMLLIVCQKETGSALVYLAFFLVLYREGMRGLLLFSAFCAVLFFIFRKVSFNSEAAFFVN